VRQLRRGRWSSQRGEEGKVQTESESEETDGLLSKSSKSGKQAKNQRRTVDTTDYLIFGMLVSVLACEFLAYLKHTGYST
jgi:hypothetical protein